MTDPKRGGKRPGAGRKPSGKVRLQCWVEPETKAALGPKPGPVIDALAKITPQPIAHETDSTPYDAMARDCAGVEYKSVRGK